MRTVGMTTMGMTMTMDEQSAAETTTERSRVSQSLANPRRLRIGRDGRPLPLPSADED